MLIRRVGRNGCLLGLMSFPGPILASSYMWAPALPPRSKLPPTTRQALLFDLICRSIFNACVKLHCLPETAQYVKSTKLAARPALRILIQNKRIDHLSIIKVPILIQPYKHSPQTWHIRSKIKLLVSVYSIQCHSALTALITYHELFSS